MISENTKKEVIKKFEELTGITGLNYELVTKQSYDKRELNYLVAQIPPFMLGIMGNNMKDVELSIYVEDTWFSAKINYAHKDGGYNSMSVMVADGSRRAEGNIG